MNSPIISFILASSISVHWFRKDLSAQKNALSEYALKEKGWILTIGLFSMGVSQVTLAIFLLYNLGLLYAGILFLIAGIGPIITAAFKTQPIKSKTFTGYMHDFGAGIEFIIFPFALLVIGSSTTNGYLQLVSFIFSFFIMLFSLIIIYIYLQGLTEKTTYWGVIQRINIYTITLWMLVSSYLLM
ncbi:MAG: DUF998 domain-containing protein [Candidatus Roizmanbacteria bacterium]|nr:DUF998 domain-containing protein [Candidatus Roizmanbacteria bacterium]